MFLTLFYMMATWLQAWRLSALKARLITALTGPDIARPSIMLYAKPPDDAKNDQNGSKTVNIDQGDDFLSSHLCTNRNIARLGDLLWCYNDKKICTIYPQQKIEVNGWLLFPKGKTEFPLCVNNHGQSAFNENSKIHVLLEAEIENYFPLAYAKATKLEDYGNIVTWTIDRVFAAILETDLDHMTKLSIALMHGKCFINNGLLLTRIESIAVSGKPCVYNSEQFGQFHQEKKLIGKAQWDAHIKKMKVLSSTARHVAQREISVEVDELPGVLVSPGNQPVNLQMPTILEIKIPRDTSGDDCKSLNDSPLPVTPPPTPATITESDAAAPKLPQTLTELVEQSAAKSQIQTTPEPSSSLETSSSSHDLKENSNLINSEAMSSKINEALSVSDSPGSIKTFESVASIKNPQREYSTSTAHFSPSKKPPANFNCSMKPPDVLIYADSTIATDNIKNVLGLTLNSDKYTIYTLSSEEARKDIWMDQAVLVVVCGNVGSEVSAQLVDYLVRGGQLLALCSDTLHTLLPSFKTAEVREHELVRFSYGKWKHVQMMHHIFCYQASPVKSRFSQDQDDSKSTPPQTPVSANVRDGAGKLHTFHVKVLGTEETWHTPSILLANLPESGGRAVFSQIHLEADPSQYEFEESKFNALKQSNAARLEIFSHLLTTHFGMETNTAPREESKFTPGFFLGRHELKLEMLEKLKERMSGNDIFKTSTMELQFCEKPEQAKSATSLLLPIMVHQCPDNFSTVEYFENLKSKELGRLVIYADLMTSSMNVVAGSKLHHGLVVIPRQQSQGQGRNKNIWISPLGCAMFTMQLHLPLNSVLGSHISVIQHLVSVAAVSAVKSIPGYENIDLRLKWPNDIYAGSATKIGGLIVTSLVESSIVVCNIGLGINLSNSTPTSCINDVIVKYNEQNGTKLPKLTYERFLALVFTEIENLLLIVQSGNMTHFFELYYNYWMHTDAEITVLSSQGESQSVQILGIDRYGFLEVRGKDGNTFTVHPDGNSFDFLKGLIAPMRA